jgi:hypothetical protein
MHLNRVDRIYDNYVQLNEELIEEFYEKKIKFYLVAKIARLRKE